MYCINQKQKPNKQRNFCSLNTNLNYVGAIIGSENDLTAVKWSVYLHNEENYVWQCTLHKNKNKS